MSYRDEAPGTEGLERYPGFMLLRPGFAHSSHVLTGDKGITVFRIYPEFQQGTELRQRIDASSNNFTNWMRFEKVIRKAGVSDKFTCCTRVKGKDWRYKSPIDRFVADMRKAIEQPAAHSIPLEWAQWKQKLPNVEFAGLLQGMMIESGKRKFAGADGRIRPLHPCVLIITRTAREELEKLCNTEIPNYTGNPEDHAARFASGDIVSCAAGKPVAFVFVPKIGHTIPHYEVSVANMQPFPIPPQMVASEWQPWDNLLNFLTEAEQMDLLIKHYPPEAVDRVFHGTDMHEMLPQGIRGKWQEYLRKIGFAQAPGYPQAPQGAVPSYLPTGYPQAPAAAPVYPPPVAPYAPSQAPVPPQAPPVAPAEVQPYVPGQPAAHSGVPVAAPAAPAAMPWNGQSQFGNVDFGGGPVTEAPGPVTSPVVPAVPPQAFNQAAPAPVQPVGDPAADASRVMDVRARLANAQAKAAAAAVPQQPPQPPKA